MGFAANNGILYSFGGVNGNNAVDADVEAYQPATDSWVIKAAMPTARYSLGVAAVNGKRFHTGVYPDVDYSKARFGGTARQRRRPPADHVTGSERP